MRSRGVRRPVRLGSRLRALGPILYVAVLGGLLLAVNVITAPAWQPAQALAVFGRSSWSGDQGYGSSCGWKRYCGQMSSCSEAQFYFRQCGVASLDGDGDGVPCEAICGSGWLSSFRRGWH